MTVTFPTAPEVCLDCKSGRHVVHIITELGDLQAEWEVCDEEGQGRKILFIRGHAEDELFLEDLLRVVALEYGRMQDPSTCQLREKEITIRDFMTWLYQRHGIVPARFYGGGREETFVSMSSSTDRLIADFLEDERKKYEHNNTDDPAGPGSNESKEGV